MKAIQIVYIILGTISLILGIIGIFLPLLPTTPFLLLTAALYLKGSQKLYNKLLNNKYLGSYIKNFQQNKAIPVRVKIVAVSMLWITMLFCVFFIVNHLLWVQIILIAIAIGVTIHILRYPNA